MTISELYVLFGSIESINTYAKSAHYLMSSIHPMDYIVVRYNLEKFSTPIDMLNDSIQYNAYRIINHEDFALLHHHLCQNARESMIRFSSKHQV